MVNKGMTSKKGLILLCVVFIAFGIYLWIAGAGAMKTGALIRNLSPTHAYEGYEVVFFGTLSVIVGVGGIWAVLRKEKEP